MHYDSIIGGVKYGPYYSTHRYENNTALKKDMKDNTYDKVKIVAGNKFSPFLAQRSIDY